MKTYKIRVIVPFTDMYTGKRFESGEILETDSAERVNNIINQRLGELASVNSEKKKTKKVLIHHNELYKIGGIETATQQISKAFPKQDITFIINARSADPKQVMELSKRHSVILDNGLDRYEGDVLLLMNYNSADSIINRVDVKKIYQFCHADWSELMLYNGWQGFKLQIHPKVDKVLSASETAQKGLKKAFGIDSVVVPNILNPVDNKRLVFLVLSRATKEKGIERVLDLADSFSAAGKDFVIFLCASISQATLSVQKRIEQCDKILALPPSIYAQELLRSADYLLQLSDTESYCYSVREALQAKVPCIVTDTPELRKIIKDGENGYVLNMKMSNLNIDKIFNHIPKPKDYAEKISPLWAKVMEGKL